MTKRTFRLGTRDGAIIIREDGSCEVKQPKEEPQTATQASNPFVLISMMAAMLYDRKMFSTVFSWFEGKLKQVQEAEAKEKKDPILLDSEGNPLN